MKSSKKMILNFLHLKIATTITIILRIPMILRNRLRSYRNIVEHIIKQLINRIHMYSLLLVQITIKDHNRMTAKKMKNQILRTTMILLRIEIKILWMKKKNKIKESVPSITRVIHQLRNLNRRILARKRTTSAAPTITITTRISPSKQHQMQ